MLVNIPTLTAVLASGALVVPAGAAAQGGGGGVLTSGYAPAGVSEESTLGVPAAPKQSAHATPPAITAGALVAKARPTDPMIAAASTATTTRLSTGAGARTKTAAGRAAKAHAQKAAARRAAAPAHAQAAVVEAAAGGAGPASGLGSIWIFGGAVLVLAAGFAALWRGRTAR